eukprot:5205506-Pyramimonas_sp.AAC.1
MRGSDTGPEEARGLLPPGSRVYVHMLRVQGPGLHAQLLPVSEVLRNALSVPATLSVTHLGASPPTVL